MAEKPVCGLVLSGGGGRGAYECGVYKGLHEHGIEPDILVGTSIGAINAAAIVAGASPEDLERMWLAMDTKRIHKRRWDFWNFFRWRNLLDHSPIDDVVYWDGSSTPGWAPVSSNFTNKPWSSSTQALVLAATRTMALTRVRASSKRGVLRATCFQWVGAIADALLAPGGHLCVMRLTPV